MTKRHRLHKAIIRFLELSGAAFCLFWFATALVASVGWSITKALPASNWIQYYSVESAKQKFNTGEDLSFLSEREVKKTGSYIWTASVKCLIDDNDGVMFVRVGNVQMWPEYQMAHPRKKIKWSFPLNNYDTTSTNCDLVGSVAFDAGYGVTKTVHYKTKHPFSLGENQTNAQNE